MAEQELRHSQMCAHDACALGCRIRIAQERDPALLGVRELWQRKHTQNLYDFQESLARYVAQQTAAKEAEIGAMRMELEAGQRAQLQQGAEILKLMQERDQAHASGILAAAKYVREFTSCATPVQLAEQIESLASQHPQPTAGQEVEDAGTLRINTHAETSDERIRELRETPMTLECFATLERVLSERHVLLVDAANRAIASERAAGKGGNDENGA